MTSCINYERWLAALGKIYFAFSSLLPGNSFPRFMANFQIDMVRLLPSEIVEIAKYWHGKVLTKAK